MNATITDLQIPRMQAREAPRETKIHRSRAAMWEAFVIAVDSIWSHKMRSILTLLGIIIGVASVVAVGGAIEGLGSYVSERLVSTFGSNTFVLARLVRMNVSDEEYEEILRKNKRLYPADLRAISELCDGCEAVVPALRRNDDIKAGNRTYYDSRVNGVSAGLTRIQELELEQGRFLTDFDVEHSRPYAVIGADIREELFGPVDALGKEIKVAGDNFTIVGVEKSLGSFFGQAMDNNVYIPYTQYLKKYGSRTSIIMRIKAPSAETLQATQDQVRVIMRTRHKLRPNQEDDFDILASQAIQESVDQITGAIAGVVTPITLISLVVGGIVVMNIMLVTVTERTSEVGLRKALGARRSDILLQFLMESALLATMGGVIGLLLGYGVAVLVRNTTPVPMTITFGYIVLSVLASGGIGIASGIYPAHKASKLDPIVALARE